MSCSSDEDDRPRDTRGRRIYNMRVEQGEPDLVDDLEERGSAYHVYPLVDDLGCNRSTSAPSMYIVEREVSPVELQP